MTPLSPHRSSPQPVEDDSDSIVCSELSYDSSPFLSSKYFSSTLDIESHDATVDPLELSPDGVYRTSDDGKYQTHTEQSSDVYSPPPQRPDGVYRTSDDGKYQTHTEQSSDVYSPPPQRPDGVYRTSDDGKYQTHTEQSSDVYSPPPQRPREDTFLLQERAPSTTESNEGCLTYHTH